MSQNYKSNKSKLDIKSIIFTTTYFILTISLFSYFFYCINKIPPSHYVSKSRVLSPYIVLEFLLTLSPICLKTLLVVSQVFV